MKRFKRGQIVITTENVKHLASKTKLLKGEFVEIRFSKPTSDNTVLVKRVSEKEPKVYWPTINQIRSLTSKERYHFKKLYPHYV